MQEVQQKPDAEEIQQRVDFLPFACGNGDSNIADHAKGNAVGDAVGERHHNAGQNRWIQGSFFLPVQSTDFTEHLNSRNYKHWCCYGWDRGYGLGQWENKYQ